MKEIENSANSFKNGTNKRKQLRYRHIIKKNL